MESVIVPVAMLALPNVIPGMAVGNCSSRKNISSRSIMLSCIIGTTTVVLFSPAGIDPVSGAESKSTPAIKYKVVIACV